MAHFYASIQGNRGSASRMGTKGSGMTGHVRGWNIGARVNCYVDDDGNDCVEVRVTGGSNSRWDGKTIGTFYRTKKGQLRRKK